MGIERGTGREQGMPVRAEGDRIDRTLVGQGGPEDPGRGGTPEAGRAVGAPGEDGPAVGAERGIHHRRLVAHGFADERPVGRIPQPGPPVPAGRQDAAAVGAEGGRDDPRRHVADPGPTARPVATSQSLPMVSSQPVTIIWPSGRRAATPTGPSWRSERRSRPEAASHRRAVWSSLPVRMVRPSGPKAAARTAPSWWRTGPMLRPVSGLPEPHGAVVAGGQDGPVIGAEPRDVDGARMLQGGCELLPVRSAPEMGRAALADRQQEPAIAAERHARHGAGMGQRRAEGPAGCRVPEPCRAVLAAGGDRRAVAAVGDRPDPSRVLQAAPQGVQSSDQPARFARMIRWRPASSVEAAISRLRASQSSPARDVALLAEGQSALEGQAGREPPRSVEGRAELPGRVGLVEAVADGDDGRGQQRQDRQPARGREGRVAPAPAQDAPRAPDRAGQDRLVPEEPLQLVGELSARGVSPRRLLLQALEADRLQVAREAGMQPARRDGSAARTSSRVASASGALNGGRPVSSS